ncbi:toluene hydroxylase, partial [Mesorhizobium sp. M7D.F.Ca.US.004.01.2.1]
FQGWVKKHGALADKAATGLQPIWSMPHSKPVAFADVRAKSEERIGQILGELGLKR